MKIIKSLFTTLLMLAIGIFAIISIENIFGTLVSMLWGFSFCILILLCFHLGGERKEAERQDEDD